MSKNNKSDWLFAKEPRFVGSFPKLTHEQKSSIPALNLPLIALCGRSNVGKSSLINALFNRQSLAFTSKTPGRTHMFNLFEAEGKLTFLDLPGYGYAKTDPAAKQTWQKNLPGFFEEFSSQITGLLLFDLRHGLKDSDQLMIDFLRSYGINIILVGTKKDKLNQKEIAEATSYLEQLAKEMPFLNSYFLTSAKDKIGLHEFRLKLSSITLEQEL